MFVFSILLKEILEETWPHYESDYGMTCDVDTPGRILHCHGYWKRRHWKFIFCFTTAWVNESHWQSKHNSELCSVT